MRKALFFIVAATFFSLQLTAQKKVQGKVIDENGAPLSDVSVTLPGSKTGTITTADGSFSLTVPSDATRLVFSSVGMETKEAVIPSDNFITLSLSRVDKGLEEVIVVAYGQVKKGDFTGSANQVSGDDFKTRGIMNPLNAIVATGPGVQTTAAGGSPGSSPGIRIRGFGSISASDGPLIVVDGIAYDGGLANLNSDDIETITTLKDASTVALWGSRASNGVIMITTRKGSKNRNTLSIKATQGFSSRGLPEYERVNAFEYYPLMWESMMNALIYPTTGTGLTPQQAAQAATNGIKAQLAYNPFKGIADNDIVRVDGTINPNAQLLYPDDLDWAKELIRQGIRNEYVLSYAGGNDKSDFLGSFGYVNEKGYLIRSDWRRFTGRLVLNTQPQKWIKTGLNISGSLNQSNQASDGSSTGYVNPFFFSRTIGPIYPVYAHNMTTGEYLLDDFGNRIYDLGNMGGLGLGIPNRPSGGKPGRHVIEETKLNKNDFRRNTISGRAYANLYFTDWLNFATNIGADITDYNSATYENTIVGDGAPAGRASKGNQKTISYTFNQVLNFNKRFDDHNIGATAGHENYDYTYLSLSGSKQGEVLQGSIEFPNFSVINSLSSSKSEYRIESYFGRINYDFAGKYFISANARRDGNSRFFKDVRWANFYGVGLAWRIDKENFMNGISWVNSLKLRSSYGQLGNDAVGTYYAYQSLYSLGRNNADEPGALQSQLPNPLITWETSKPFDVGVDFGLLKNRLRGTVEYYHRNISGLIFDVQTPLSDGGFAIPTNIGNMYNSGIEAELIGEVVKSRDFSWTVKVNSSTIKNRITKMPAENPEQISGTKKLMEGHSIYDYWLRDWYGVDPDDGAGLFVANNGTGSGIRLKTNKDGKVDTLTTDVNNARYHYAGTAIPDLFGGIENTFSYKGFTLNFLLQYQIGGKVYDNTYAGIMSAGNYGEALHKDALKRWQKPGDITDVPRMQNNALSIFGAASDRWLLGASFLNIRSVTVTYNFPKSLYEKLNAANASVFIGAENVYLFSKRKGTNINQSFAGTNSNSYTPARIITAGINLNF
ncbi:MAG: SusC/RagA family TonB-linked outer membrane protein [Chitinophagaceae bacterium]|nr:SusC/RagA family TonB-linked outer membrane protein [Chitinophagaceae bacterium]